jgi:hypothetical protein
MRNSGKTSPGNATLPTAPIQAPAPLAGPRATVAKATEIEIERYRRERKQSSEGKSEAVVRSVFVETYQSDRLPHESFFSLLTPFSSISAVLRPSLRPLFGSLFLSFLSLLDQHGLRFTLVPSRCN